MWYKPGQLTSDEIQALNSVRGAYTLLSERGWADGRHTTVRVDVGWYDVLIYPFNRVFSGRYSGGKWVFRSEAHGREIELPNGPDYYRPRERAALTRSERRRADAISGALYKKAGLT
jgi:hypothetical protein